MTPKTVTAIWRKVALVFLGLVLAFALLEGGMRFSAFVLSSIQEYRNFRSAKEKGTYRILCLGESTTQGQYPSFLQKILNENSRGLRFSVIDKGRVGTDSFAILAQVESDLNEYHPQMVVAMLGVNDQGVQYYLDIPECNTWIFQECHVYRLCRVLFKLFVDKVMRKDDVSFESEWDTYELSEFSDAEDFFGRVIKTQPRNDQAFFNLGRLYHRCEKISKAEALLLRAVELNPQNSDAYNELGQIYHARGQRILAKKYFEKTLSINPQDYQAFISLKRVSHERGVLPDQDEALLKKATEAVPCFYSYVNLGQFYRDQGRWAEAEDAFQKAAVQGSTDCIPYLKLGELYRFWGKLPEAIVQFEKALAVNPQNKAAMRGLISMYTEEGKTGLAAEWTEKAIRTGVMDYSARTIRNLQRLQRILGRRGIKLICVQYPMRNIAPLKKIFEDEEGVIFVDNERVFKDALKEASYKEYFIDMFGGDFGHCTPKGNELLAKNIADVILEIFFAGRYNAHQKQDLKKDDIP